jgi:hypothetical protein
MRRGLLIPRSGTPAFVAVGAVAAAGSIPKPAGVQNGDTCYVLVARTNSAPAGPAGFDLVGTENIVDEDTHYLSVYRRTIDGSEGSTFAATGNAGAAAAYRAISATASATATSDSASTTLTYPDLATSAGQAVIGFGLGYGASAIATPSGHTERLDSASGSYRFQVVDIIPAVGDVGSATATATSAQVTIAVRACYNPA